MPERLTIAAGSGVTGLSSALVAGLPLSYAPHIDEASISQVLLLAGNDGWAEAAAASGSSYTVVADPGVTDPQAVEMLAANGDGVSRLFLSETYAGNRAVSQVVEAVAFETTNIRMQMRSGETLEGAFLKQLRLARALGVASIGLIDVATAPGSAIVKMVGKLREKEVRISALTVRAADLDARLDATLYGSSEMASLTLSDAYGARAGYADVVEDNGARQLPTIYETTHRATLRELSTREPATPTDLRDFASDLRIAHALAGL